jgi:hypothetical protein
MPLEPEPFPMWRIVMAMVLGVVVMCVLIWRDL